MVPAGEERVGTEILASLTAVRAETAVLTKPGDADAVAERKAAAPRAKALDDADDLVAGHDKGMLRREITLGHVQVGAGILHTP